MVAFVVEGLFVNSWGAGWGHSGRVTFWYNSGQGHVVIRDRSILGRKTPNCSNISKHSFILFQIIYRDTFKRNYRRKKIIFPVRTLDCVIIPVFTRSVLHFSIASLLLKLLKCCKRQPTIIFVVLCDYKLV